MAKQNGDFDDEGFFESLLNRKDSVPMPESMVSLFKIIGILIALVVVVLVAWKVWPDRTPQEGSGDVPVVRAEATDYKVAPDEPGGMPIPNKDSTIFETMNALNGDEKKVENLLEDSEEPLKKEDVFKSSDTPKTPVVDEKAPAETALVPAADPHSPPSEAKKTPTVFDPSSSAPLPEEKKSVIDTLKEETGNTAVVHKEKSKPATSVAEKVKADAPEVADVKMAKAGASYIQLASVKTQADAQAKWAKLQSAYVFLKPLSLRVSKADLGPKGTFYRVQVGPVSIEDAKLLCSKMKAAKGDCLVVR